MAISYCDGDIEIKLEQFAESIKKKISGKMSVVIPYHGARGFFNATMDNLTAQTTHDFEVVISDDSDDQKDQIDLLKIIEKYSGNLNLSVVRTKPNLGAIANTLQGIKMANNDIIRILHTDDAIAPDTIRLEIELFEQHPDAVAIFHNATLFRDTFIPNQHGLTNAAGWIDSWLKKKALMRSIVPSALAFRCEEMLSQVGFYNPDYEFTYDWEHQCRLFEYAYMNNKKLIEVAEGYIGWRLSHNQESSRKANICWKDSRNLLVVLRNSYNRMGFWPKDKINNRIKELRNRFNCRLLNEYHQFNNFNLPLSMRMYCIWKWMLHQLSRCKRYMKRIKRYKLLFRKKIMMSCLTCDEIIPLIYKNQFYYYNFLPVNSLDFSRESVPVNLPKTAVILQGPILYDNNFTLETIKIYKRTFPSAELIISTWLTEDRMCLKNLAALGVYLVKSDKIDHHGRDNLNLQIISTRAGIRKARELGCKYVLKTRTDQRFYATNILQYLFDILKTFPVVKDAPLKSRLIACSFNTFKYRWYGISDMFLFGHIEDVEKYWNIPFDNAAPVEWSNCKNNYEVFERHRSETYIAQRFLEKIGWELKNSLADSYKLYAELFVFIDRDSLQMFWPKYSNKSLRWNFFDTNPMEEIKFADWLNLYHRRGVLPEWAAKEWDYLPNY